MCNSAIPTLVQDSFHLPLTYQEDCFQTLLPLPEVAHTFGSSVYLRPDLSRTHAPSASIAPITQKLTHTSGRQGNAHVTNSSAATHKSRLARCFPHAPALSRSNRHDPEVTFLEVVTQIKCHFS